MLEAVAREVLLAVAELHADARHLGELERGVTVYKGYGGMTGAEQEILYCVVTRLEIGKVKTIVRAIDPHAFVVSHPLADAEGGVVKRANVPLVFWAHDVATGTHWTERLARRVRPDLVICNSRYTADSMRRLYGSVPAIVLACPIDTNAVVLTAAERAALRQEFDTPADATVLIQVSRLEAWKGHAVMVDALAQLLEQPGWVWWIVGGAQRPGEVA